ncbi:BTAD domain-containing putative transcriptional regulator [Streptomyces sp. NPDC048172]|uniref:AfsR/SARP family transcriptional regulator n=1 Tax=Streptomyces sp. NPDC048172 TaxID=3365505 RepID=UPI003712CA7E
MRFRVLGPVSMAPRTPSAAKPRAVLATLLVQNGSVVPAHTLIDELWATEPPRTAATTLQVYVSQLRKALGGDSDGGDSDGGETAGQPLLTQPPGYLIQVGPDELDLNVFESLRAEGRTAYERRDYANASLLLGRALTLWTGSALSGIPHGPCLETNAVRLDELRTEVLEQRISADLWLGRHHELTGELMALANEHPMRETLHAHLMVALYRSGRQSDALGAYQRARRALIDELGVEPGPVLTRLQERILASDPALAWQEEPPPPPPVPTRAAPSGAPPADPPPGPGPVLWLPPAASDFTGRGEELASGGRMLAEATGGGGGDGGARVLAVSGRAGVGKTALAVRLAHGAAESYPDGRVLLRLRDAGGRAVTPAAAMTTLLRRLRREDLPGTASPRGQDELADLLYRATEGRKLLLVLDDAVSEGQVRPLLGALPDTTVLVTGRRALGGLDGVQHLVLDVLEPRDAERLLREAGGRRMAEEPRATAEIARLCGCLPLALRVAAAGLAARAHWTAPGLARRLRDERTRLAALALCDLNVRGSLLTACQEVGDEERRAFRLLALAPQPDFPLWTVAALLGTDLSGAERLAEELTRSHLLEARRAEDDGNGAVESAVEGSSGAVRYGFPSLLRNLAVEMLDELAAAEPRTAPRATERLGRAWLTLARHADARLAPGRDTLAGTGDFPDENGAAWVGPAPLRWFREESTGLLEAVRQCHAAGLWRLCCALASAAGGYYEACALWDDWETAHELALDAARHGEDALAEATLLRSLGDLAWQRRRHARALDRYRLARHVGGAASEGRCLTGEADVLLDQGQTARASRTYERALAASRASRDPRGAMEALRGLAFAALRREDVATALDRLAACGAEAEALGDNRWASYARRVADRLRETPTGVPSTLEVRPGIWLIASPHT